MKSLRIPSRILPKCFIATLAILVSFTVPIEASAQEPFPNNEISLYRIQYSTEVELKRLAAQLDVWEVDHSQHVIVAALDEDTATTLRRAGKPVKIERVLRQGLDRSPIASAVRNAQTSVSIPGFPCYRTTETLQRDMRQLAQENPDLVEWRDIGDSWDKVNPDPPAGHDLFSIVVTNRQNAAPKFRYMIVAAMHPRELVSAEIAARFAERLVNDYGIDPDITWLLDYGEAHIIPLANPDGRVFADQLYYWRKNTNSGDGCTYNGPDGYNYGVDLNRNAYTKWGACEEGFCSSVDPCAPTFRGTAAVSEPETQALQDYAIQTFADQRGPGLAVQAPITTTGALLSLHSYAQKVMYPWSWSGKPAPNANGLQALAERLAQPLGYVACQTGGADCLYQVDGDYVDWAYARLGIPAFTMEFGTAFFQNCSYFETAILNQSMESLIAGFKYARQPYALSSLPSVDKVEMSKHKVVSGEQLTLRVNLTSMTNEQSANMGIQVTVDVPSWVEGTEPIARTEVTKADSHSEMIIVPLETDTLSVGQHVLLVEAVDGEGRTGIPSAIALQVTDTYVLYMPVVAKQ